MLATELDNILLHEYFARADDFANKVNFDQEHETIKLPCEVLPDEESRLHQNITVHLKQIKVVEDDIRIQPGTIVTWVNEDSVYHTVTSDSEKVAFMPVWLIGIALIGSLIALTLLLRRRSDQ